MTFTKFQVINSGMYVLYSSLVLGQFLKAAFSCFRRINLTESFAAHGFALPYAGQPEPMSAKTQKTLRRPDAPLSPYLTLFVEATQKEFPDNLPKRHAAECS